MRLSAYAYGMRRNTVTAERCYALRGLLCRAILTAGAFPDRGRGAMPLNVAAPQEVVGADAEEVGKFQYITRLRLIFALFPEIDSLLTDPDRFCEGGLGNAFFQAQLLYPFGTQHTFILEVFF